MSSLQSFCPTLTALNLNTTSTNFQLLILLNRVAPTNAFKEFSETDLCVLQNGYFMGNYQGCCWPPGDILQISKLLTQAVFQSTI